MNGLSISNATSNPVALWFWLLWVGAILATGALVFTFRGALNIG